MHMPYRTPQRSPLLDGLDSLPGSPRIPQTPAIFHDDMTFGEMCDTFKSYFLENIDTPQSSRSLKTSTIVTKLGTQLIERSHNPSTLAALLWCKAQFSLGDEDETGEGIWNSRALACEIVACDFVSNLSAVEALRYLCHEQSMETQDEQSGNEQSNYGAIPGTHGTSNTDVESGAGNPAYVGLNTLEIAVLADAKKFISHRPVQRVINGIWDGSISFWNTLDVGGSKKPHFYNPRKADPFCRLRVPRYQKTFEALFFAALLALYYTVLYERNPYHITGSEVGLIVFFLAFVVDELSSMKDSGILFYAQDFWSWLDMSMIFIGIAYLVWRILGVVQNSDDITDTAFDILSLEALLLIPRVFSLLSLNPYFGVLVPCLKQMTKEFMKFFILIVILFVGFLTTFSLISRDRMSTADMSWTLINVFFGSSYMGFDAMREVSPVLGPPLMLVFVILTNILLITSLISLLSNSLTNMMMNAREEYLFMFTIMVLEASTSNRLVVFYPPLNLLPLILLRPLRLIVSGSRVRRWRIALLKLSHFPVAAIIMAFEKLKRGKQTRHTAWGPKSTALQSNKTPLGLGLGLGLGLHPLDPKAGGGWAAGGRLGGTRLGPSVGGGGGGVHMAPRSPASSARLDDRSGLDSAFEYRNTRIFAAEDQEELRNIRKTMDELNRKMDELLGQQSICSTRGDD
ncbi:hypothetical protein EDC01DRAFT_59034 [Geopyxis carbonaria]|nr:hypothetical protein EDC01DRAFT_59034 [Geopyxis carbonaria]